MTTVASRELRNNTRDLLDRVAAGESITITVDGREVAVLAPVKRRQTWVSTRLLFADLVRWQADAGLRAELDALSPDTTDDLPLP